MRETTDTSDRELSPEMTDAVFTITKGVEKRKTPKGSPYYIWHTKVEIEGTMENYTELMMVFMAAPILRALHCSEPTKGKFEWDREEVVGMQFRADVVHEPDFKDKTKMRAKWKNVRPYPDEEKQIELGEPAPANDAPPW